MAGECGLRRPFWGDDIWAETKESEGASQMEIRRTSIEDRGNSSAGALGDCLRAVFAASAAEAAQPGGEEAREKE